MTINTLMPTSIKIYTNHVAQVAHQGVDQDGWPQGQARLHEPHWSSLASQVNLKWIMGHRSRFKFAWLVVAADGWREPWVLQGFTCRWPSLGINLEQTPHKIKKQWIRCLKVFSQWCFLWDYVFHFICFLCTLKWPKWHKLDAIK